MEDIIDIIVTETTNTIEITAQPNDEIIDVNIIDNREDITLNVTPTVVEININSLTGNFGILWGEIEGTLSNQTDLQNVLNLKADLVDGKVPSSQLPSYVDDVVEVANYAALPVTGEVGKIYITLDTNFIYRWTGSTYVEIKDSSAVWGAITGTLSNQTDLQNALNAKLSTSTAASTYVPYTGATANVNLGLNYSLTAALIIKSGGTSTQFLKADGSIDTNTYLTTGSAASTYLALSGGTLTGALNGTSATFSGDLTLSATNPRLYFTDTDNNPDYFISNTDGTFTIYDVTNSTSRFTIGTTGNGTFGGNLTVGQIIRSGGTSSQFLKADGSVDSSTYAKRSGLTDGYLPAWSSSLLGGSLTDSFISYASNITYVSGMGLSTLNGLDIEGNYGAGTGGLKIRSYDETTGNAYIDFANTGGRMYLGLNRSTSGGLMTNATAYATVLTTGLGTTNLEFGTNATKRVTIDGTTGAVTLTSALSGTSATFSDSANTILTLNSTNTNGYTATQINYSGVAKALIGFGTYLTTDGGVAIRTAASTPFTIAIGGGTPTMTLATSGAATFSSSVTAGDLISTSYGTARIQVTSTTNSANSAFRLGAKDSAGTTKNAGLYYVAGLATSNTFLSLVANDNDYQFNVLANGNVGIGTTAPTQSLDVSKAGVNAIRVINTANASDAYYIAANTAGSAFFGINSTGPYIYTASALDFTVITNNTERMRITSSGHIQTNGNPVYAYSGSISIGGTYQTIFAAVSGGVYLVSVTTDSADGTFGLLTVVNDPDKSLGMIYGNNISLQFSGDNVQMKSTNGSTYNTTWTATRLK